MKKLMLILFSSALLLSCSREEDTPAPEHIPPAYSKIPKADHVIFVWLENKNYNQIIDSDYAPYINSLIPQGTYFSNFHALGHPSYPEYIRFFSAQTNGKSDDVCITGKPYSSPNLYTQLTARGKSFAWYSEDLPATGSDVCQSGAYLGRHNPTHLFTNVPNSVNKRFADFPTNYAALENVVCITPNMNNDMHNGSVNAGDNWVKNNLKNLVTWCKTHNSVFVIYFDEDNGTSDNRIPVIMVGQPVKMGFKSGVRYDHYDMARTILEMYGAAQIANTTSSTTISDIWK